MRRRAYGAVSVSVFDPASLFAGGAAGLVYDFSDLSTLYQTEDNSTPVTADGQAIGRIEDLSGNGNHATQVTAAARPVYKTAGGLHWSEWDNDHMDLPAIDAVAKDWSLVLGLRDTSAGTTTNRYVLDAATGRLIFATAANTQGDCGYHDGAWRKAAYGSYGADAVLAFLLSSGAGTIREDASAILSGAAYTQRAIGGNVVLGSDNGGGTTNDFPGRLYRVLLIEGVLSGKDLDDTEAWAAEAAGVAL